MPNILIDLGLQQRLEIDDSFLARREWVVLPCGRADWIAKIEDHNPALLVLLHDPPTFDALSVLDELRSRDLDDARRRIVCILSEDAYTRDYDRLAEYKVACLVGDADEQTLLRTVTELLEVPGRVNVRAKVVFELQGRDAQDKLFTGRLLNISSGGFLLESEQPFEEGQTIYCFFTLAEDEPMIFSSARIGRLLPSVEGLSQCGVEFVDLRLTDRRRIADFVLRSEDAEMEVAGGLEAVGAY